MILSSGALNDTHLIDDVFDRLEDGNALENVDEFLTQLTQNEKVSYSSKNRRIRTILVSLPELM